MKVFIEIYRKLDETQRKNWFRGVMSALVLIVCGGVFGSLIYTSYSLDQQVIVLLEALESENLQERDEHAVSLFDTGTVTVGGRTYESAYAAQNPGWVFNEDGYIAVPLFIIEDMLREQVPAWAPGWLLDQPGTTWLLAVLVTTWLLLIIWMAITIPFAVTVLGTGLAIGLLWLFGWVGGFNPEPAMLAVAGIGMLTFTYVLLTRGALILYQRPNQILAVAHTVIKEASRSRISLVFIILLLVTLPMLPFWLDPEAPLRYRVQTFISRSMNLTFVLAACMTLFLACATVAFEIRDRQIWQVMTKPMNRMSYILGKWLGVVTVNLILLIISGVSTFTFIQYLRTMPVAPGIEGQLDAVQVRDEVLTARVSIAPVYQRLTPDQIRERIEQMIDRDPDLIPEEVSLADRRRMGEEIRANFAAMQRSVPPGQAFTYRFTGLQDARGGDSNLSLRYRFFILADDQHETFPAMFIYNEDPDTRRRVTYVPTMSHVQLIPPDYIDENGNLTVTLINLNEPPPENPGLGSINFEENGFELLYKVANFEGNFLRAVMIAWMKLAFLAMLGIFCATFLSFAVACLLSFTIFMAGSLGPFLAMSLELFEPLPVEFIDWSNIAMVLQWAVHWLIRLIAEGLVFSLRAFGEFSPTQNLVEGRLIPWGEVATGFATLGLFWSGTAMLLGYLVIRSRQLAIYSGQGG